MNNRDGAPVPTFGTLQCPIGVQGKIMRYPLILVFVAAICFGAVLVAPTESAKVDPSAQLAAFVDDFLAPVSASRANDLSAASFAEELNTTKAQLARLRQIDRSQLSLDEEIDWRLAESILVGQQIQQEKIQLWKKDPRVYLQCTRTVQGTQTVRNEIQLTIAGPGDPALKAERILRMLQDVPIQLENGKKNLAAYVPRFQALSVLMAENGMTLFDKEVPSFAEIVPAQKAKLLQASDAARAALRSYLTFLKTELPKRPRAEFAVGKETYDAILKQQHLLPYDSGGLYKLAWDEFSQTVRELEAVAMKIDASQKWQTLAEQVKNEHPDPSTIVAVTREWVNKARDHVISKRLVPIPWKERFIVLPRAEYLRSTPNLGQILAAHEKGPPATRPADGYPDIRLLNVPLLTSYYNKLQRNFSRAGDTREDGAYVAEWQVDPFQEVWPEQRKKEYLAEHDWGVIIVMGLHESYPGHQVQGLYWMHNPRKLRRERRVFFGEGWGFYSEHLMQETGFLPNERVHLRQLHLRLWRNARAIWDVGIHTGKLTEQEAISQVSERGSFPRWAARFEVDIAAQAPGARIGWLLGLTEILKMREEFKGQMGSKFSLGDFHERLLKVGDMPPALMRDGLMATASKMN